MPDFKKEIRSRLAALNLSPSREAEIVEELSQHLEDQYEQALSRGASEEEAYQTALTGLAESDLGELKRIERRVQQEPLVLGHGKTNLLGDLAQDFRYGLRMLLRNPGFTIVAVLALALGIGANSAIFSVVNTVLLRPLPYKNPDRLVMVWEDNSKQGFPRDTPAAANYIDWRDQNHVFEGMAAIVEISFNLTGAGDPERIDGRRVSASLFPLLGVEPQLGRAFRPEEDRPGANHVVIMSHGLWQRRFGSDPGIIGKPINLNGESFTVVGVMPGSFQFPTRADQLWIPIAFDAKEAGQRGNHYLEVIARMKPGTTLPRAQAEMTTIAGRLEQQFRSMRDGNKEIYLMNSDGTHVVRITNDPADDTMPAISPNGDMIVFSSNRESPHFQLYLQRVKNGKPDGPPRFFQRNSPSMHARFSPDGKWVVFVAARGALENDQDDITRRWLNDEVPLSNSNQPYGEIFVAPVEESSKPIRLTHNRWEDSVPTWGVMPRR